MKEVMEQMAGYNVWANSQLLKAAAILPEDVLRKNISSSFPSVFLTVLHLLDAETIWWQRLRLEERILRPSDTPPENFKILAAELTKMDNTWREWVKKSNEHGFQHQFIYSNTKKEQFKQPVYQMLIHLFNHSTYHRGQLITLLRQCGLDKLPGTDFIGWSRNPRSK